MNTGHDDKKQKILSAPRRPRSMLLSLLLVYSMIQSLIHAPLHTVLASSLLIIFCIYLLWWPRTIQGYGMILAAASFVGMVAFTVWLAFGLNGTIYSVILFLTGWVTYRLPTVYSAEYTVATAASAASILFYVEQDSPESVLTQCLGLAAVYLIIWGSKARRETQTMKERHLAELTAAHQQLENAYDQLHQAHLELAKASESSLRYAVMEERSRIAADIHDSVGHGLTSVIVQLQALPYIIQASPDEARSTLRNVTEITRGCLQDVRSVVHEMGLSHQDSSLHELRKLTQIFSEQNGLSVSFSADDLEKIAPEHIYVLYRILQEALTNILRHAEATSASVNLTEQQENIIMIIRDNGQAQAPITPGFGLTTMKGRCEKAGGSMSIRPVHPQGLELTVQLPRPSSTKK
ncbi:sensor histidine kinase [Paenibacillus sp.]|jgi:signal transduction histidine kinase|uniref:sensor histidine kinase n=1 Tax=Paenibacillus sp. TaxID=58172 RepID=UPI00281D59C4|nr:sensor histidine kinase [Paenibacillus sp.]MDR0268816.1 sensor histidine kinase [Paenibacillus sp.]